MSKNKKKKASQTADNQQSTYSTLGLADPHRRNNITNTTTPSIEAVEETRKWSQENKK